MSPRKKKMTALAFGLLAGVLLLSNAVLVNAAGGDLDTTFTGTGANAEVSAIAVQADGKIIIGGRFIRYNGILRRQLARLNSDGTLDTTFDPGTGPDGLVGTIIPLADGKIIINGGFTNYNGTSRKQIARLNSDGTLDATFDPGQLINGDVYAISLLPNGKYIIGGAFPAPSNSALHNFVMRLNADGTPDNTFISGGNESGQVAVTELAIQPDGKIIIGGQFGLYDNIPCNSLARLNSDGSFDNTFQSRAAGATQLYTLSRQPDGKIIIGGQFNNYDGVSRARIARVNSDGTLDTTFNPGIGADDIIFTTALQPDGKIIVGGFFTTFDGASRKKIARLNANGSLDTTFNPGTGITHTRFVNFLSVAVVQADGKVLIGGFFDTYNGATVNNIARLLSPSEALSFSAPGYSVIESVGNASITLARTGDTASKVVARVALTDVTTSPSDYSGPGSIDASFNGDSGFTSGTGTNNGVGVVALQADGKIILGGGFTVCRGVPRKYIARLNQDSTLDTTFDPGAGPDQGAVSSLAVQADGKILISGFFFHYNGVPRKSLARLNSDGSLDTTFNPGAEVTSYGKLILQPDGKIILMGDLPNSGFSQPRAIRLNTDGTLDSTFTQGVGANASPLSSVALQPDGKVIVTGGFTTYNGISRSRIVRLNSDGSVDTTFNPVATGMNEQLYTSAIQEDGKIIVGGEYTDFNGFHGVIRRLNPDGSLDSSFNPGTGVNLSMYATALQPDGKIIISGNFTTYNGTARLRLARLNSDGSLDTTFAQSSGANNPISSLTVQEDGRIIIAGEFTDYNGAYRSHIGRVYGDIFVNWNAGDASNKTVLLPIANDSTLEPTETLTLSITPVAGGAPTGSSSTATLTILDNDTRISAVSGSGVYKGTFNLTATLSDYNSGLSGRTITFNLFGIPVGTATTDANGVATLLATSNTIANARTYTTGAGASFAGETNLSASSATGPLVVGKATPVITWSNPSNIIAGTALGSAQLNATANVPGTFKYTPPAGTVLDVGAQQLSVTFTPSDSTNYTTASMNVPLTVEPLPLPTLLTEEGTERAIALDAVTMMRDPFQILTENNLSADHHTRVMLFALNIEFKPNEPSSILTAQALDSMNRPYPLTIESVVKVPGMDWLTQLNIILPDDLSFAGDVRVFITLRGIDSNKAVITIKTP